MRAVTDPCDPDPCDNGGTCSASDDGYYVCTCPTGWTGINCDIGKLASCNHRSDNNRTRFVRLDAAMYLFCHCCESECLSYQLCLESETWITLTILLLLNVRNLKNNKRLL